MRYWGDKFDKAGCCSVVIPCNADCVYIVEDDCHNIHNIINKNEKLNITALQKTNNGLVKFDSLRHITDQKLSFKIQDLHNNVDIYPNPSQEVLNIVYQSPIDYVSLVGIEIYSVTGEKIFNKLSSESGYSLNNYQIDISSYNNGMYFIRSVYNDGSSTIHKFIKF